MTKEEFAKIIQSELGEANDITPLTNFKELDSYGSLSSVLIMQLVEDHLKVKINPRSFRSIKNVEDIASEIGEDAFSS